MLKNHKMNKKMNQIIFLNLNFEILLNANHLFVRSNSFVRFIEKKSPFEINRPFPSVSTTS